MKNTFDDIAIDVISRQRDLRDALIEYLSTHNIPQTYPNLCCNGGIDIYGVSIVDKKLMISVKGTHELKCVKCKWREPYFYEMYDVANFVSTNIRKSILPD